MDSFELYPVPSISVSELTRYISNLFEADDILRELWVNGEISNLSRPASGHVYFTLKDALSSLRCVVWKTNASNMTADLQEGKLVEAHGAIGVYERGGQYQLYIDTIRPAGEGFLYQEFLRLKNRLEEEGLFDPLRKKNLPTIPKKIGIVTSSTGAALQDILNTLSKRYTLAELVLAPTQVQGEGAALQIVKAIHLLNQLEQPDVIIVARGGGSVEDLFVFNSEIVVRAIADSQAPIITGIGHETDFTLADFAADLRAPTPTGAAIAATPDSTDLASYQAGLINRLANLIQINWMETRNEFSEIQHRLERMSPMRKIENNRQRLDEFNDSLNQHLIHHIHLNGARLAGLAASLNSLNPHSVLKRGYAIVSSENGTLIKQINQVHPGLKIQVQVSDGIFGAVVHKPEESQHPA